MLSASGIQTWMAGTKAKCTDHLTFWNHLHQWHIDYLVRTKPNGLNWLFQCFACQDDFDSWNAQNITLMFHLPHSFIDSFQVRFWPQCLISIFRIRIKIFQPDISGFLFSSRFFDPVNNRIGLICDLMWSKIYWFSYKAKQTLFCCYNVPFLLWFTCTILIHVCIGWLDICFTCEGCDKISINKGSTRVVATFKKHYFARLAPMKHRVKN